MKIRWARFLLVGTLLVGGLTAVQVAKAPPAQAYITGCSQHGNVAQHTTAAGNVYVMHGHICRDVRDGTGNTLNENTRAHWHCFRNGAPWDGCRVRTELVVEWLNSAGQWVDAGGTAFDIVEPSSGYFANSQTRISFTGTFADGVQVRGKAEEEDSMRFLLADGTSVVLNMTDQYGPPGTVCTIDPC